MNAEINTWAKNIDWTKAVLAFALGAIVGAIIYQKYLAVSCPRQCVRNGQWYCTCPSLTALSPSELVGKVLKPDILKRIRPEDYQIEKLEDLLIENK